MTKNEFRVNRYFTENYTEDEMVQKFQHYTNKNRGKHCSEKAIRRSYQNNKIGSLMRRYDPIGFNLLIQNTLL
jgi:hypothetical protein